MEDGALVAESLLVGAEGAEILGGLGHHVGPEEDDDATHHLVANLDVQVDLRVPSLLGVRSLVALLGHTLLQNQYFNNIKIPIAFELHSCNDFDLKKIRFAHLGIWRNETRGLCAAWSDSTLV